MKEAWKGSGLTIDHQENGLVIAGQYWGVWIEHSNVSNVIKAKIVEFCGEIPAYECAYTYCDGKEPQSMLSGALLSEREFDVEFEAKANSVDFTRLFYLQKDTFCSIVQNQSNAVGIVNNVFREWIDLKPVQKDLESMPEGPKVANAKIMWRNEYCRAQGHIRSFEGLDEDMIKTLQSAEWPSM